MRSRFVAASDRFARLLPRATRLGFRLGARQLPGALEREIGSLDRITGRGRVAVDAGADEGWYSLELSSLFDRILAFEPNESLLTVLRGSRKANIEAHAVALSDADGTADLFVPIRSELALSGWGSLDRDHLLDREGVVRSTVPTRTLDSFELGELDFLKVDVEGHELRLLTGASDTLARLRPTVLVEIQPRNLEAVCGLLGECGLIRVDEAEERIPLTPGDHLFRARGRSPIGSRATT